MTNSFRTLDDVDVKGKAFSCASISTCPWRWQGHRRNASAHRADHHRNFRQGRQGHPARHFGRPKGRDDKNSEARGSARCRHVGKKPVAFADDCIGDVAAKAVAT
jgi:phosphoglycerate kinase